MAGARGAQRGRRGGALRRVGRRRLRRALKRDALENKRDKSLSHTSFAAAASPAAVSAASSAVAFACCVRTVLPALDRNDQK